MREQGKSGTLAIVASFLAHLLLVWIVLELVIAEVPLTQPPPVVVTLVREPPPEPPKPPEPVVEPEVVPEPPPPPPKARKFKAARDSGLSVDLDLPEGDDDRGAIGVFVEGVKSKIQAAKSYPPGLPGMANECMVRYRVTINRQGEIVDYDIDGCGNPYLDSATRAAILKAAPYPFPPDFGGDRHDVYGTLIYWKR